MGELKELRLAYAECSKQRNELLNKLKSQPKREWVGLTELERCNLFKDVEWDFEWDCDDFGYLAYARAIEAALRSKNNG
jgi:hypothetical protein